MNAITIHPESSEQLKTVKTFLKACNIPFESQVESLPEKLKISIDKGLIQSNNDELINLSTFKTKFSLK